MSGLDRLAAARDAGRKLLVPYLTAGHPDAAASAALLAGAADAGADAIELGVPFSDPLADGPVIAAAARRALDGGATLATALALAAGARDGPPLVLFGYLNPLHAWGFSRLAADARAAGVAGVLVADQPFDEDAGLAPALAAQAIPLIRLAAPTTPETRLRALARGAEGFVYLIARTGVTGAGAGEDPRLAASVRVLREETSVPILVGFGIADADGARRAAGIADGVVVGSALVARVERDGPARATAWLATLRAALDAG